MAEAVRYWGARKPGHKSAWRTRTFNTEDEARVWVAGTDMEVVTREVTYGDWEAVDKEDASD